MPDTNVDTTSKEWIPTSFDNFIIELNHISDSYEKISSDGLLLFRGHKKRNWLLDSTFVRSAKELVLKINKEERIPKHLVDSKELHLVLLNLYLLKYGRMIRPSDELESVADNHGIDSWFELMKRHQQYEEEDNYFIKGTNLIDWSKSANVALYFANSNRTEEGAIFICDAKATGKTLQTKPVGEILDLMNERGNSEALGPPLLFCPPKQILNCRAKNQQAIYFAQMDLRYDLESIWRLCEKNNENKTIFIKLVLPLNSIEDAKQFLDKKMITEKFIYPE